METTATTTTESATATTTAATTSTATTTAEEGAITSAATPTAEEGAVVPTATVTATTATTTGVQTVTVKVSVVEESVPNENLLFGPSPDGTGHTSEYYTVALIFGIFLFILLLILIRRTIEKYLNEILVARLNSIMKDAIVLITALTFVLYLDFINVFDPHLSVSDMCLLFLVFALFWFTLSTILILIGQAFCVKWEDYETAVPKRGNLFFAIM